jgi:transposase InsO family protein
VNHKRLHRVYRAAGLSLCRKRRKHCVRVGQPLRVWTVATRWWALDFAHDPVARGRAIRVLSVVDAYTRECLALEVDTSFASRRVTRVLEAIVAERGQPQAIRCDNGPELPAGIFWRGAWSGRSSWCTFSRASRRRTHAWKLSWTAARRVLGRELVSESVRCAAEDHCGAKGVQRRTNRTAVWDTEHRKNLLQR